jgi:hypothetical protein
MPHTAVYSFDREHEAAVASGAKRRTIRPAGRRRHAAPGDALRLYVGMRTKDCRLIGSAVCTGARGVLLRFGPDGALAGGIDGSAPIDDAEAFARLDGFAGAAELGAFFQRRHGPGNFAGVLIEWGPLNEDRSQEPLLGLQQLPGGPGQEPVQLRERRELRDRRRPAGR